MRMTKLLKRKRKKEIESENKLLKQIRKMRVKEGFKAECNETKKKHFAIQLIRNHGMKL